MSNMSYCRFENTNSDLADCESALEDLINGEGSTLNEYELGAAKSLAERCERIVTMLKEFAESNDLDEDFAGIIDQLQLNAQNAQEEEGDDE